MAFSILKALTTLSFHHFSVCARSMMHNLFQLWQYDSLNVSLNDYHRVLSEFGSFYPFQRIFAAVKLDQVAVKFQIPEVKLCIHSFVLGESQH